MMKEKFHTWIPSIPIHTWMVSLMWLLQVWNVLAEHWALSMHTWAIFTWQFKIFINQISNVMKIINMEQVVANVPSFFRCPISGELMKSPVTLCTGFTWDLCSIPRWLDDTISTWPIGAVVTTGEDAAALVAEYPLQCSECGKDSVWKREEKQWPLDPRAVE